MIAMNIIESSANRVVFMIPFIQNEEWHSPNIRSDEEQIYKATEEQRRTGENIYFD